MALWTTIRFQASGLHARTWRIWRATTKYSWSGSSAFSPKTGPPCFATQPKKTPDGRPGQHCRLGEVLSRLAALRAQFVERVDGLSSDELARIGVHSRFGEMTLVEWLEFFLLHEGHHFI